MSKITMAAIGAVAVLGFAGLAGAQTQVHRDSVARHDGRHGQMGQRGQRGMRGMREEGRGDHGRLMADLNLTDAQKNQIKAIHAKYQPQLKALHDQGKTQLKSMREAREKSDTSAAARAKFQQEREAFRTRLMALRQQEQNEVRAILTSEQRTKWDAAEAQRKTHMEERQMHMNGRGAGKNGKV